MESGRQGWGPSRPGREAKADRSPYGFFFFQPTVLTNCRQKTDIMQKEIFGPVLPITTFKDLDEAIESRTIANTA